MLRVSETYLSLQGEGRHSGLLCYFIRTAGCDLRCRWCDSPQALQASSGKKQGIVEICKKIPPGLPLVQITGGEPLLQKEAVLELFLALQERHPHTKILLETGGHRSLADIPAFVHIVMDIKLAGSGENQHNFKENLKYLKPSDEIKFVIEDRSDYEEARAWLQKENLETNFGILFSPVYGKLKADLLAGWIIEDRLRVRFQMQLHKAIWGNKTGI